MSKELEAVISLRTRLVKKGIKDEFLEELIVIETALKELEVKREVIRDILTGDDEKKLKALQIIKECFDLNGFDELIPNNKWFESEEKQDLLKKVLYDSGIVKNEAR